jgi:hypothetical protein
VEDKPDISGQLLGFRTRNQGAESEGMLEFALGYECAFCGELLMEKLDLSGGAAQ